MRFVYKDYRRGSVIETRYGRAIGRPSYGRPFECREGEIIFECEASDILEADYMFLLATGVVAAKEVDIGCQSHS